MAKYDKQFCCSVLTPNARIAGVDAVSMVVPAADGQMGILANRAPVVAMLRPGPLRIEQPDGKVLEFIIGGGFMHVRANAVTVLAEECRPAK